MDSGLPLNVFSGLQKLRFDAANTDKTALQNSATIEQVAIQFESLLLHEMLKGMRATVSESSLFGSDATDQYQEMYDQQLALHIAQKGLGLKDMLMQQLGGANRGESIQAWVDKDSFTHDMEKSLQAHLPPTFDHKAVMAIAALETGWGQSVIANKQGLNSHNVFSIKASSSWQGEQVAIKTHEFIQDKRINMTEPFRVYNDMHEAIDDFVKIYR